MRGCSQLNYLYSFYFACISYRSSSHGFFFLGLNEYKYGVGKQIGPLILGSIVNIISIFFFIVLFRTSGQTWLQLQQQKLRAKKEQQTNGDRDYFERHVHTEIRNRPAR